MWDINGPHTKRFGYKYDQSIISIQCSQTTENSQIDIHAIISFSPLSLLNACRFSGVGGNGVSPAAALHTNAHRRLIQNALLRTFDILGLHYYNGTLRKVATLSDVGGM